MTLWVLAGVFAHILLGIFSSSTPDSQPIGLGLIFPNWPLETYKTGILSWTHGWAVFLGVIFWYHTTTLIVSDRTKRWRLVTLIGAYILVIFGILLQAFALNLFTVEGVDQFLIDTLRSGFLYPFFAILFILFSALSVSNLVEAAHQSSSIIHGRQIKILIIANLATTLGIAIFILGSLPGSSIPVILISLPLLLAVIFFGYGVARFSALMEHRVLRRNIIYNGMGTALVVLLYLGIFLWINATYDIPDGVVVFMIPLVILSHSAIEEVHLVLDHFVYDHRTRNLRANLRRLSRLAGEQASFDEMLSQALEAICKPVKATYGVVLLIEKDTAQLAGAFRWYDGGIRLSSQYFLVEDVYHPKPGSLPQPFIDATLLIPLYAAEDQIGVVVLGRPENGIHYSNEDVRILLDPCDRIAELVIQSRRINAYLNRVVQMPLQPVESSPEPIPTKWVEDVLQNSYDYAHLGDSPLVNLKQVQSHLACSPVTCLDKGKAVYQAVTAAVEKLRPGDSLPSGPIPRDWFPYLILYHAYIDGMSNRDIMSKLNISEGTFNRTRRSALRSVTRVLGEIEANID